MHVVADGTVFRGGTGTDRQSAIMPSMAVLPGGRWLCSFRAARSKSGNTETCLLTFSDTEGSDWSEPVMPWPVPEWDGRPGRWRQAYLTAVEGDHVIAVLGWIDDADPRIPYWNEQDMTLTDTRICLSQSLDRGDTWSTPAFLDLYPIQLCTPLTGPILVLRGGEWVCHFELNKRHGDPSVWRHASIMAISRDQGRSWPLLSVPGNDPANRFFYWDQRPGVLDDGTVLDTFWTLDSATNAYANIHARRSTDGCRTWSEMWDTNLPGQPGQPVSLRDGRIALSYVDRTAEPKIKLRCSDDGGRSWTEQSELVIYDAAVGSQTWEQLGSIQDSWAEMAAFSVGLPATTNLPDGGVLVCYYAGPETDATGIEWARLGP